MTETLTMTPERFGGKDYAGVRVLPIGDDADTFASYGHIPCAAMAEAAGACYQEVVGPLTDLDSPITVGDARHAWAVAEIPTGWSEWRISWRDVKRSTRGAFPVTLVEL